MKRDDPVSFRLDPETKRRLHEVAKRYSTNVSDYLRMLVAGAIYQPEPRLPTVHQRPFSCPHFTTGPVLWASCNICDTNPQ